MKKPEIFRHSGHLYSGHRLAQTTWFVTSAYFAFLIAETTKDGLVMAIFDSSIPASRIWIIVPTLIFYFLSAAEAYLWLNPRGEDQISATTASFRGALLVIYIIAVVAQSLLLYPCREKNISESEATSYWLFSFSSVLGIYILYNIVWTIKLALTKGNIIKDDRECPSGLKIVLYIGHYATFITIAMLVAKTTLTEHLSDSSIFATVFFSTYLIIYFVIWWNEWHRQALSTDSGSLYGSKDS